MSWVKLDDGFYDNAKVEAAGFDGAGLFAMCLSYCGRHLTDGFVPDRAIRKMGDKGPTARLIAKVTEAGLWRRVDGGYKIPDYTKENPTKKQTLEKRARDVARKRALAELAEPRLPDGFHAELHADDAAESAGTPGTPARHARPQGPGSSLRAVQDLPFTHLFERIVDAVRLGPNEESGQCVENLAVAAAGLSEGQVAKVAESCEHKRKRIGMGYAINALKSERAERQLA